MNQMLSWYGDVNVIEYVSRLCVCVCVCVPARARVCLSLCILKFGNLGACHVASRIQHFICPTTDLVPIKPQHSNNCKKSVGLSCSLVSCFLCNVEYRPPCGLPSSQFFGSIFCLPERTGGALQCYRGSLWIVLIYVAQKSSSSALRQCVPRNQRLKSWLGNHSSKICDSVIIFWSQFSSASLLLCCHQFYYAGFNFCLFTSPVARHPYLCLIRRQRLFTTRMYCYIIQRIPAVPF